MYPSIGNKFSYKRIISSEEVIQFANLSGDTNSLHLDPEYASTTNFKKPIIHGFFLSSLISKIAGTMIKRGVLLLSNSSMYVSPAYPGEELTVECVVKHIHLSLKIVEFDTKIFSSEKAILRGKMTLQITD